MASCACRVQNVFGAPVTCGYAPRKSATRERHMAFPPLILVAISFLCSPTDEAADHGARRAERGYGGAQKVGPTTTLLREMAPISTFRRARVLKPAWRKRPVWQSRADAAVRQVDPDWYARQRDTMEETMRTRNRFATSNRSSKPATASRTRFHDKNAPDVTWRPRDQIAQGEAQIDDLQDLARRTVFRPAQCVRFLPSLLLHSLPTRKQIPRAKFRPPAIFPRFEDGKLETTLTERPPAVASVPERLVGSPNLVPRALRGQKFER